MGNEGVKNKYNFRPAPNISKAQLNTLELFAGKFEDISDLLGVMINDGRYLSVAQTKLEEASAAVNKAIAFDGLRHNAGYEFGLK